MLGRMRAELVYALVPPVPPFTHQLCGSKSLTKGIIQLLVFIGTLVSPPNLP